MKEKIFGWIFKKELKDLEFNQKAAYYQQQKKDREITSKVNELEEQNKVLKRIFKSSVNHQIIGFESNKFDNVFVVKEAKNNDISLYLYGPKHKGINLIPNLYSSLREHSNGEKSLYIHEVQAIDKGIGNGSILMNHIMNESRKMGLSYISGELSPVDKEKFSDLKAFYEKHGYEVKFYGKDGSIVENETARESGSFKQKVTAADNYKEQIKNIKNEKNVGTMQDIER